MGCMGSVGGCGGSPGPGGPGVSGCAEPARLECVDPGRLDLADAECLLLPLGVRRPGCISTISIRVAGVAARPRAIGSVSLSSSPGTIFTNAFFLSMLGISNFRHATFVYSLSLGGGEGEGPMEHNFTLADPLVNSPERECYQII